MAPIYTIVESRTEPEKIHQIRRLLPWVVSLTAHGVTSFMRPYEL